MGLSAAKAFVAAGASVIVIGLKPETLKAALAELGKSVKGVTGDATKSETIAEAVRLAVESSGRLDGLYNVAGGSGRRMGDGPLHEIPTLAGPTRSS